MFSLLLADLVLIIHVLFIVFVIFGGVLALRWHRVIWIHLPCAVWGMLIEFRGWICPLTYLENDLRKVAGASGYSSGFIEHYLTPIIYPPGLTQEIQILLGISVIIINLVIYSYVGWCWHRDRT